MHISKIVRLGKFMALILVGRFVPTKLKMLQNYTCTATLNYEIGNSSGNEFDLLSRLYQIFTIVAFL